MELRTNNLDDWTEINRKIPSVGFAEESTTLTTHEHPIHPQRNAGIRPVAHLSTLAVSCLEISEHSYQHDLNVNGGC